MIKAPQGGGQRKFVAQPSIAAGTYPARIVQVIDMGLQPQRPYKVQEKPPAYEVGFTYELVDTFVVDEQGNEQEDKPRWISETIPLHPLVADKAKSTQRYHALDPEENFGGDFSKLADIPCNVLIVNNQVGDRVYDNVASISPMRPRDAAKCPPLVNDVKVFSLEEPNLEVFNKLPAWIQDKIKSNLKFKGSKLDKLLGGEPVAAAAAPLDGVEDANGGPPFEADDLPY